MEGERERGEREREGEGRSSKKIDKEYYRILYCRYF